MLVSVAMSICTLLRILVVVFTPKNEANKEHPPNSLNQLEAEVIVHSDFLASNRDCGSQLHMLDLERTPCEDGEPEPFPTEDIPEQVSHTSSQQDLSVISRDQDDQSEPGAADTLLKIKNEAPQRASKSHGADGGLPQPGGSGDSESSHKGEVDTQPILCDALPTAQPQGLLHGGLASITDSPLGFENAACVHHL